MNYDGVKSDNVIALDRAFGRRKIKIFGPDRVYTQLNIGGGIVAHTVIIRLGFHWRHAVLSKEQNGVQIEYGMYYFSTRAPEVVLPVDAMKGFKGRIMQERHYAT